jgi:hypothetical protein
LSWHYAEKKDDLKEQQEISAETDK